MSGTLDQRGGDGVGGVLCVGRAPAGGFQVSDFRFQIGQAVPTGLPAGASPRSEIRNQKSEIPASAHRTRTSGAYTLVEVLVALALVALILPVATHGVSLALNLGTFARHQAEAATLARAKLDDLVTTGALQNDQGDFGTDQPGYTWTAVVQSWDGNTVSEMDVTVKWTQRLREHSVMVSTLVYTNSTATTGTTGITGTTGMR